MQRVLLGVLLGGLFIGAMLITMAARSDYYFCSTVVTSGDRCLKEGTYPAGTIDEVQIVRGRIHYADGSVTISRTP